MDWFFLAFWAAVGGLAVRIYFERSGGREARINRQLARRRRVLIRQAREGLVCLLGHTQAADELLAAPITLRQCLAFQLTVTEHSQNWSVVVLEEGRSVPFRVVDSSGEARVVLDGSRWIVLEADAGGQVGGWLDHSPLDDQHRRLLSLLKSRGIETEAVWGRKRFSFDERILGIESAVVVLGAAFWEAAPDGERQTPRGVTEQLVLRNTEEHPLVISNARAARAGNS